MDNKIYKLSKYVLKRFEESANDEGGLEILYNTKTNQYWFGNPSSRYLINLLDGKNSLNIIYKNLSQTIFKNYSTEEIKSSFITIISELTEQGFIEENIG